ncbi:MAG TPA: hypothetical protein VG895_02665 [Patescibacteria group bacterium]|nr:hypothetical protein [Patescibacteria group bacterium]
MVEKTASPESAETLKEEILLIRNKIVVANLINHISGLPIPLENSTLSKVLPEVVVVQGNLSGFIQSLTPRFRQACGGDINQQKVIKIAPDGEFVDNDSIYLETDNFNGLLEDYACVVSQEFRNLKELLWIAYDGPDAESEETESEIDRYIHQHRIELLRGFRDSLVTSFENLKPQS